MQKENISKAICRIIAALGLMTMVASCSTTSSLKDGEQLYTGLFPIEYTDYERSDQQLSTQEDLSRRFTSWCVILKVF